MGTSVAVSVDLEERTATLDGDGTVLVADVVEFLRRYVVLDSSQTLVVGLWTLHTWVADAAQATPYLHVTSPTRRSGKSRLLEVLRLLVRNPLLAGGVSEAALFRSISAREPTLLIDEVDAIFRRQRDRDRNSDVAALLNNGYRRGAPILRCVGEHSKQRVEEFDVFCPKVLAGLGGLPDTIADRAFTIRMKRRVPSEQIERFRERKAAALAESLRERLEAWASAHVEELADAEPELPDELDDRGQDVVEPLLAIAEVVGIARAARKALVRIRAGGVDDHDEDAALRLLADVRRVFDGRSEDRISTRELIDALCEDDEAPWATWSRGDRITSRSLAHLVHGFGVRSRNLRFPDGTVLKGFTREQFDDAFSRYLPSRAQKAATALQPASLSQKQAESIRYDDPPVADTESGANPHEQRDVADVTAKTSPEGEARVLTSEDYVHRALDRILEDGKDRVARKRSEEEIEEEIEIAEWSDEERAARGLV